MSHHGSKSCNNSVECWVQEGRVVLCRVLVFVFFLIPRVPKGEVMFGLGYYYLEYKCTLKKLPSDLRHVESWEQKLQQESGVFGTRGTSSSLPCFAVCVLCCSKSTNG